MKHFAKFLAILHHNASFFNFCFIINFGFIKKLLHILEILKLLSLSLCYWLSLIRVVRFSIIFGFTSMQFFCYYDAWLGKCLSKSQYLQFYSGLAVNKNARPNTSFFEKIRVICFIIASYLSLICLIMASYMRHRWIWWRILDTAFLPPRSQHAQTPAPGALLLFSMGKSGQNG